MSIAPDDVSGLNVSFSTEERSVELEYVHQDGVRVLATDDDRSKHAIVYRAFKLGLEPENVPHGIRFSTEKVTRPVEVVTVKTPGSSDVFKAEVTDAIRNQFRDAYARWKAGKPTGTMLASLSKEDRAELGLEEDTLKILASGFVDSVEQLAGLSDQHVRGLMGGITQRAKAQAFLAKRAAAAVPNSIQEQLDALFARIAALEQRS